MMAVTGAEGRMVAEAIARRGDLAGSAVWRLLHRGEHPERDCAVECYGDWLSLQAYEEDRRPDRLRSDYQPLVEALLAGTRARGCLVRFSNRNPHQRRLVRDAYWVGSPPDGPFEVTENGLRFVIELAPERHPGLFLDQRETRRRVREFSNGRNVANLFAYTCSFSVAAVAGGANQVVSVDLARGCLETGKHNLRLNGLEGRVPASFIREDARKWLTRQRRRVDRDPEESRFGLVVCDPPVFAAGGKGTPRFSVETEWDALVDAVAGILHPDGIAVFANNHRGAEERHYETSLVSRFERVERQELPIDFRAPGPPHSRTWWCERPCKKTTTNK